VLVKHFLRKSTFCWHRQNVLTLHTQRWPNVGYYFAREIDFVTKVSNCPLLLKILDSGHRSCRPPFLTEHLSFSEKDPV